MNYAESLEQKRRLFFPYAARRQDAIHSEQKRFVHYCSADTAMKIIDQKEVWMRKSNVMNDFQEIEYGLDCIENAYKSPSGDNFRNLIDGLFPEMLVKFQETFDSWVPNLRFDTYLTCISEHDDTEDHIGRLSMWRAYGGKNGVAIVLNPAVFLRPTDALRAYTSPVVYLGKYQFVDEFRATVDRLSSNQELLKFMGAEEVFSYLFQMFRYAALCTKHPGFHEEREWRVIYSPKADSSDRMIKDITTIRGIPQPIYKIPLTDIPEEGLTGASIPKLVNRVIVGPTDYPMAIKEAVVSRLSAAGVVDASERVFVSDIPLRVW